MDTINTQVVSKTPMLFPYNILSFHFEKVKSKHSGIQYLLNICGMTSATDANCAGAGVCRIITTKEKKIYQNLGLVKYQQLEYDMVSKAIILKYRQDDKGKIFFHLFICC